MKVAVIGLMAIAGCAEGPAPLDEWAVAEAGALSVETCAIEATLIALAADGVGPLVSVVEANAARDAATAANRALSPPECVATQFAGNRVSYALAGCTGDWGLGDARGALDATLTPRRGGALDVGLKGDAIVAGGATRAVHLLGTVTEARVSKTATVKLGAPSRAGDGTGPWALRSGEYTATWEGGALSLAGVFSTTAVGTTWATAFTGYQQARRGCPRGMVTLSSDVATITLTFAGAPSATWTQGARSGTVSLRCTP